VTNQLAELSLCRLWKQIADFTLAFILTARRGSFHSDGKARSGWQEGAGNGRRSAMVSLAAGRNDGRG